MATWFGSEGSTESEDYPEDTANPVNLSSWIENKLGLHGRLHPALGEVQLLLITCCEECKEL